MGCCESDMHVRKDQFHQVPMDDSFQRGHLRPRYGEPGRGHTQQEVHQGGTQGPHSRYEQTSSSYQQADGRHDRPNSTRSLNAPYGAEYEVYRTGDNERSTVLVSRPGTGRSSHAGSQPGSIRNSGIYKSSHRSTVTSPAASSYYGDDEELVLICEDCLCEVIQDGSPARCPITGKLHN